MKKTAVDWLVEKIKQAKPTFKFDSLIREAKTMEKDHIIQAYNKGEFNQGCNGDAEQYYNETYGTKG